MGRIAEESIQQVIAAADIVELVGSYFPLKRAGTSWKACCPFHAERTPSFSVSPVRNTFHCFGCGKGGTAIRFVMEYENLPFADAVRKLAQRYGIRLIEEQMTAEDAGVAALRVRMLALHREASAWMHQLLLKSGAAGEARGYLKSRGLDAEVAKRWQIGYAPPEAGVWRGWAAAEGFPEALLVEGGIFSPREEGRPEMGGYPRFKHRVMFPIRNDHGDVIGFSGRVLDAAASPAKYINSPATAIFTKSQVFFGLDQSKRAIHREQSAIICEGQIDMIMCYEHGIENIVAPLGTAFTPDHARLLKRHTDQVVLCFDADNAGLKAARSCFGELAKEGIFVRVARLPVGEDPDSLLRSGGAAAFREHLSGARDFIDFLIDVKAPGGVPEDPRERMRVLSEVTGAIARTRDRITQDGGIARAALRLNAPPEELRRMVTAHARQMLKQQEVAAERAAGAVVEVETGEEGAVEPLVIDSPSLRLLLQLALGDPEGRGWLVKCGVEYAKAWEGLAGGSLLSRALAEPMDAGRPEGVGAWLATLGAEEEIAVSGLLMGEPPGRGAGAAEHGVLSLRIQGNKRELDVLVNRMKQAALPINESLLIMQEVAKLQKENLDLSRSLRDIPIIS